MEQTLINRVAQSGLITINLEDFYPEAELLSFDIKDYLFQGLILKEKDFRKVLREHDWSAYSGKHLNIFCSTDAIIPTWAYMLVTSYAQEYALSIFQGSKEEFTKNYYNKVLDDLDYSQYEDKRIVIKGCSNKPVPPSAYSVLTGNLRPHALSIMYGEPCSTVPIYKRSKK